MTCDCIVKGIDHPKI